MKKLMKWYVKYSVIMYVVYSVVGFLGGKIIEKHPLKNEEHQWYVYLLFTTMRWCVMSPCWSIKYLISKTKKVVE